MTIGRTTVLRVIRGVSNRADAIREVCARNEQSTSTNFQRGWRRIENSLVEIGN